MVSQAGDDVEMACSFRGDSSSPVSLEIQWWYTRHSRDWAEQPAWTTNQESLYLFVQMFLYDLILDIYSLVYKYLDTGTHFISLAVDQNIFKHILNMGLKCTL